MNHPQENYHIKDFEYNYIVSEDIFKSDAYLTSLINRVLLLLGSFILISTLLFFYINLNWENRIGEVHFNLQVIFSIIAGVLVTSGALLGGLIWKFVSQKIGKATYQVYLAEPKTKFQKIFKYIYFNLAEKENEIYLEARGKDLRLVGIKNRIGLIIAISVPLLSFFLLAISLFTRPIISFFKTLPREIVLLESYDIEIQIAGAIFIAIILLTLYFPASLLLDSSNIRTWNIKEEKSGIPLKKVRNYIDGVAGFGAVIAGRDFYESTLGRNGFVFKSDIWLLSREGIFLSIIDYSLWLIFILLISWPFVVPTVVIYLYKYERHVNNFRKLSILDEIPISVTNLRSLNKQEKKTVSGMINVPQKHNSGETNNKEFV